MSLELKITKEPEDCSDAESCSQLKSGSRFLATVEILGALHHMDFIRVIEDTDGTQRPVDEQFQQLYDDYQTVYSAKAYQTIDGEVLGFPGRYAVFMHPYEE